MGYVNIVLRIFISEKLIDYHLLREFFFDSEVYKSQGYKKSESGSKYGDPSPYMNYLSTAKKFLGVISTFLVIMYTTPPAILFIAIVLLGYYMVQRVYVATSRYWVTQKLPQI